MGKVLICGREMLVKNEVLSLAEYRRYWLDHAKRLKNPGFDEFSSKVLDLKEGKQSAIQWFVTQLDPIIGDDVAICSVPSSSVIKKHPGIVRVGEMLAKKSPGRLDMTQFLVRTRDIPKLTESEVRGMQMHFDSVVTDQRMSVRGKRVLLIDDVTTTGNSMLACREILYKAGAESVCMLALGQAVYEEYEFLEMEA